MKELGMIFEVPEQKESYGKWAAITGTLGSWYRGRVDSKQETSGIHHSEIDMYVTKATTLAWTTTQGHFIVMGGIVLVQPEDNVDGTTDAHESESDPNAERKPTETILDMKMLEELLKDPNFKITITEEELEDKAKGDFLSKGIVILQVSWFIIQCIARFIQGLAITELEVATLALASMNGFIYFFWWKKPLGVNVPVKINLKHDVPPRGSGDQGVSLPLALKILLITLC